MGTSSLAKRKMDEVGLFLGLAKSRDLMEPSIRGGSSRLKIRYTDRTLLKTTLNKKQTQLKELINWLDIKIFGRKTIKKACYHTGSVATIHKAPSNAPLMSYILRKISSRNWCKPDVRHQPLRSAPTPSTTDLSPVHSSSMVTVSVVYTCGLLYPLNWPSPWRNHTTDPGFILKKMQMRGRTRRIDVSYRLVHRVHLFRHHVVRFPERTYFCICVISSVNLSPTPTRNDEVSTHTRIQKQ